MLSLGNPALPMGMVALWLMSFTDLIRQLTAGAQSSAVALRGPLGNAGTAVVDVAHLVSTTVQRVYGAGTSPDAMALYKNTGQTVLEASAAAAESSRRAAQATVAWFAYAMLAIGGSVPTRGT